MRNYRTSADDLANRRVDPLQTYSIGLWTGAKREKAVFR